MDAQTATHQQHEHHHEMPTEGHALTAVAISATLHCLTGCAIGEVAGMAIGTALGFSDLATVGLAVGLAFLFGYTLTSVPLLRAGLPLATVVPIALASDTLSIATMEIVDNAIMVGVPGAMEAGIGDLFFWASLAFALAIAGVVAVPVNRYLIARGKGHAAVHETGIHGGPPVRLVGAATVVAFVFGGTVLIAEAFDGEDAGHGGHEMARAAHEGAHGAGGTTSEGDLSLKLDAAELPRDESADLSFVVVGAGGEPLREFEIEHAKRMHLIVVRDDLTGFQHLHPKMDETGRWSTPITIPAGGEYRAFADFRSGGRSVTLAADFSVDGAGDRQPLPPPTSTVGAGDGYEVALSDDEATAGNRSRLSFTVSRDGLPVRVEPYLGADGHLVALREGDLAYLHTHPVGSGGAGHDHPHSPAQGQHTGAGAVDFHTEYPSPGTYRLFFQFRHSGEVHTAAFTREVSG